MYITVRCFAFLKDILGTEVCGFNLGHQADAAALRQELLARYPQLKSGICAIRLAVNGEYVSWECALKEGDEVALIPPVSGG